MPYSQPSDLYSFGIPRGAIPNPGRILAGISGSGLCALDVHGLDTGTLVSFRATGGALPSGLVAGTTYFALPASEGAFRVEASSGSGAITIADNDQDPAVVLIVALDFVSAIAWADRLIDDMLPAHIAPVPDPVPAIVRMTSAELAAGKVLSVAGGTSVALSAIVDAAQKRLARWATGVPLRGSDAPVPANLAVAAVSAGDTRGWRQFGGL